MLNQEYIPIGKLKQAFRLNAHETGVLITALDRLNSLDLYALWHEAVCFVATEEHNKKSLYEEAVNPYFPDTSDMGQGSLQGRILTKRLLRYFLYSAREKNPKEYLQRIFDRVLHFTYDEPDQKCIDRVNRTLNLIYEQRVSGIYGKDRVDIFGEYVSPELFEFFCNFFDDAIFANKEAAIRHLSENGFAWHRDIKGLSKMIVDRILLTAPVQTQTTHSIPLPKSPSSAIVIPRALWEGKEPFDAFESLRDEKKYSAAIIAHVLYHWCEFTNKTKIGEWLSESPKESSTYLHYCYRLLKKAATLNLAHD